MFLRPGIWRINPGKAFACSFLRHVDIPVLLLLEHHSYRKRQAGGAHRSRRTARATAANACCRKFTASANRKVSALQWTQQVEERQLPDCEAACCGGVVPGNFTRPPGDPPTCDYRADAGAGCQYFDYRRQEVHLFWGLKLRSAAGNGIPQAACVWCLTGEGDTWCSGGGEGRLGLAAHAFGLSAV